jgi:predicted ArsR family transcriptional regulator
VETKPRTVRELPVLADAIESDASAAASLDAVASRSDANRIDDETFFAAVAAVTAAFGDSTRRHIYLHAAGPEGTTASEVARQFAIHPNVARHHLDKLAAGGYLEVVLERAPSGAGRPSKRYRRSKGPLSIPTLARPDELIVRLLVKTLSLLPAPIAERAAEEVGQEYGASLAAQMSPGDSQRSLHAAMLAVADALTAHGFAAHAESHDQTSTLVRDLCPFGAAAIEYPVLCAMDRGMVSGLLAGLCGDAVPINLRSRALGDAICESVAG